MEMKAVWEANKPSQDILSSSLSEDQFGIEISNVVRGKAPKVYLDPFEFFRRTYFTKSLSRILKDAILTVTNGTGTPIYAVLTSFGGGKTHILIALYHFFKANKKQELLSISSISSLLDDIKTGNVTMNIPEVNVVVIDGLNLEKDDNLFQYLSRSLKSDVDLSDPTEQKMSFMLEKAAPTVILIDEIGEYIRKLDTYQRTNKIQEVLLFFRLLTSAITSRTRTFLLVTLTDETLPPELRSYISDIAKILSRYVNPLEPTTREEVVEIIKARLFEYIDKNNGDKVSSFFSSYYTKFKDYYPAEASEYYYKMIKYYPFHPTLIDTLYGRISTIPGFQKTRHTLRFLAYVVREVWKKKEKDAYLIGLDSVDLSNSDILNSLLNNIGRDALSTVAKFDIESDKGGKAKGMGLDHLLTARVIFMGSIIGTDQPLDRNAFRKSDILLGLTNVIQKVNPGWIDTVLKDLTDKLWYIYTDNVDRYWFATTPNINKAIEDTKANVKSERVDKIREYLEEFQRDFKREFEGFEVRVDTDLEDLDDPKLRLIIIDPSVEGSSLTISYEGGDIEPPQKLLSYFNVRSYKNTVIFIVPSRVYFEKALDEAATIVALERLESLESMNQYSKELKQKKADYDARLRFSLVNAFSFIFYPVSKEGCRLEGEKIQPDVYTKDVSLTSEKLAKKAMETLESKTKVIRKSDDVTDEYLKYIFSLKSERIAVKEFLDNLKRRCDAPIIPDGTTQIDLIKRAVSKGYVSYKSADGLLTNLKEISKEIGKRDGINVDVIQLIAEGSKLGLEIAKKMKQKFDNEAIEVKDDGFLINNEEVINEVKTYLPPLIEEIEKKKIHQTPDVNKIESQSVSPQDIFKQERREEISLDDLDNIISEGFKVEIRNVVVTINNYQDFSGSVSSLGLIISGIKVHDPKISISVTQTSRDSQRKLSLELNTDLENFQRIIQFSRDIVNNSFRNGLVNLNFRLGIELTEYKIKQNDDFIKNLKGLKPKEQEGIHVKLNVIVTK
ncbi:hypothetical protein HS7_03180 [Sulfolobales archaeon HS-7]|nr:hypothetical protein HS7_03180 [Sulfolobales archaeon HS-7]